MVKYDLLRGRKIEDVFEQVSRLLILSKINLQKRKELIFKDLIYLFFFEPDFRIIRDFLKNIKDKTLKRSFIPQYDYFLLKDINYVRKLITKNKCWELYSLLRKYYFKYRFILNKEGFLPALIYIISKNKESSQSQSELSSIFNITEVTLRKRTIELKKLVNLKSILRKVEIIYF